MTTVLFAESVSKEQARQIASQFLQGKSVSKRAPAQTEFQLQVALDAVDAEGQPYIYAVNMGQQNGFVLVSGDDRFREVLGYSDTGSFDNADMPENMKAWLQGYVDEMKRLDAIGYKPSTSTSRRASGIKTAIENLVQTQWDQDTPFNNETPTYTGVIGYDEDYNPVSGAVHYVIGCVATAMAQLVNYHGQKTGKPTGTLMDIPAYTTETLKLSVPAVPVSTFDWGNMANVYNDESTVAQNNAVSRLMISCASSVEMDYEEGGSGAITANAPAALKKYFGFDETTKYVNRADYLYSQWMDLIYNELSNSRPVLYSGSSSGGGHAFIVDGYDGDELFHVNWGWGGYCDSYFSLSVLNPGDNSGIGASTSNDGYSLFQGAVIGAQIVGAAETPAPVIMGVHDFDVDGTSVKLSAFNWTGSPQTFDVGIGVVDGDGNISVIKIFYASWNLGVNSGQYNMTYTFERDMEKAGQTIKVVPICKLSAVEEWSTMLNPNLYYVEVAYDAEGNPMLTLHPEDIKLSVTSFNFTGTKYVNQVQPIDVTIKNDGDEFYGPLFLYASTTSEKGEYLNYGGVTVIKGGSSTMTFEFKPTTTGTYNIWVATNQDGTGVIGQTTVEITGIPAGVEYTNNIELTFSQNVQNAVDTKIIGNKAEVQITVTNNTNQNYRGEIYLLTWKWNGGEGNGFYSSGGIETIPANSSVVITRTSLELTGANEYSFTPWYDYNNTGTRIDTDIYKYYTTTDGYTTYDVNGNAVLKKAETSIAVAADVAYVDLTGQTTTNTITSQANPNTVFFVDEGYTLSGATNVIEKTSANGYNALSIALIDNYNFVVPVDFHADKITYTRTFDKYYNAGKNWTTVVLPFAATSVKNNVDELLPWDVENRKFWLMEFSGENGSTVNFTTASSPLKANTPYIIALPGDAYGTQSLVGKNTLTFSADNVDVKANAKSVSTGTNYKFVGTMTNTGSLDNIYALNNDGDTFKKGTATVEPFRAYFAPTSIAATATSLAIGFGEGSATGIETLKLSNTDVKREGFYNLNGQRVSQPKKGLYIVNGKKVIVK